MVDDGLGTTTLYPPLRFYSIQSEHPVRARGKRWRWWFSHQQLKWIDEWADCQRARGQRQFLRLEHQALWGCIVLHTTSMRPLAKTPRLATTRRRRWEPQGNARL